MAKVKVFQKKVKTLGQGHNAKIMVPCERSCHKEYTCAIYESSITSGKKVIAKDKVFDHASKSDADTDADANADADTRAMTLAPRTFVPAR